MLTVLLLAGCSSKTPDTEEAVNDFYPISQEEARRMMDADDPPIVLDVRRQEEYDEGHLPGAVCIPNESIGTERPEGLPDLDQVILVYCRSGRRSKQAARKLADMGYTNVYEFGGILDWTGEIVTSGAVDVTEPGADTVLPSMK